jgi:hypothetical protein
MPFCRRVAHTVSKSANVFGTVRLYFAKMALL